MAGPDSSWNVRRAVLKGQILYDLSVTASEAWEIWFEFAEDVALSEDSVYAVLDEISDELRRRGNRLKAGR